MTSYSDAWGNSGSVRKGGATQPVPHGDQQPIGGQGAVPAVRGNDSPVVKPFDPSGKYSGKANPTGDRNPF